MRRNALGRKAGLAAASMAAACALVLGVTLPAHAATYNINAALNCSGALFQSDTFRTHSSGGSTIKLTKHDWWKAEWELRSGLRNTGGTQITQTLQFPPESRSTYSYKTNAGSLTIPSGSYAMNLRVETFGNGGCVLYPPSFEGQLVL